MQLSSNKSQSTIRKVRNELTKESKYSRSEQDTGIEGYQDEWRGFGELEPEEHKELVQAKWRRLPDKNTNKANPQAPKFREQKSAQDVLAQIKPPKAGNSFGPLGGDGDSDIGNGECDISAWEFLRLSIETLTSLSRLKFVSPTPIQRSALPHILAGHDAICKAPTGSGKTLAFGIPIYEHFLSTRACKKTRTDWEKTNPPIALILSPTRELAHQLQIHLSSLASDPRPSSLSIATLTGGLSVHKQQRLVAAADIVIGTPGRLWEVCRNSSDF